MAGRRRQAKTETAGDLGRYRQKRDFAVTPEPAGAVQSDAGFRYVVQKHAARRLHYDLRLELGGVLKSWAVTKGPCLDPKVRRLAVEVEDHPIDYGDFEGVIPKGQYGGGTVMLWDRGTWVPMGDPEADYATGEIKFRLAGEKLAGGWMLVRTRGSNQWLLIKERDIYARPLAEGDVLEESPLSVLSGRDIAAIAKAGRRHETAPARRRTAVQPRRLKGAKRAALPDLPRPQLASSADQPPEGTGWIHELKHDGYRTLARIDGDDIVLLTRNGHDWTDRYRAVATALSALSCKQAVLDGEICVQTEEGATSFAALKQALSDHNDGALVFFVFDLLYLDGYALDAVPLTERKLALGALLDGVITDSFPVQLSEHIVGQGSAFLAETARLGLEGIISKRADAPYVAGRSKTWLKSKTANEGTFIIVGYDESERAGGLAALLMAEERDGALAYIGKVGTGFSQDDSQYLRQSLAARHCRNPALDVPAEARLPDTRWVKPEFLADITFGSRTASLALRHAAFKGLREDVDLGDLGADSDADPPAEDDEPARRGTFLSDRDLATTWITNPDRVMFGRGGPTKLDLALYYAKVADWMLPDVANRPLTLVRCPSGALDDVFYQRHRAPGMPLEIKAVALREEGSRKRADFLYVDGAKGLLALSQFGVVEFHPWGCRIDKPERPDRLIFDLDPDEELPWRHVVEAAGELRELLTGLGLAVFVRTTGGKGLHLVVPIQRRTNWADLKTFAHDFVVQQARRDGQRYTAVSSRARRRGRIYIDYLRNGRGATAVGSYSLRARPGAPVATPLGWDELAMLDDPAALDYASVPERLAGLARDPWAALDGSARTLTKEMTAKLTIHK